MDELLGTKYSLIQVKDYIDRKISKYNHILPVNNNDLVLELKEYKSLNSKLKNDLSE